MSMHLVGPYLTTTRYNGKKKLNAKAQRAKDEHAAWLRKQGLHPDQLTRRLKDVKVEKKPLHTIDERILPALSNKVGNGIKNDIWEKIRKGEEKPETVAEIEAKAKRIAIAYNKGAYQYMGDGKENFKDAGKKNAT